MSPSESSKNNNVAAVNVEASSKDGSKDVSKDSNDSKRSATALEKRFRGYLPVVIDIETGGFNADTDAMLEIAASVVTMSDDGKVLGANTYSYHLIPFEGANIEASALEFTGIKLNHPLRAAQPEADALRDLFQNIRTHLKQSNCTRAILTGHNAAFDLAFLNAAIERNNIKRSPFHPFSCFDTATLAGLAYGQTVLAKACIAAGIEFDNEAAHSAVYDAEKTCELFCDIVNRWQSLGGWPPASN